jgi:hypothetical protein
MRLFNTFAFIVMLAFSVRLATTGEYSTDTNPLPTPVMRTVNPETVKAGEVATVSGEYLDKSRVAELFLTDGKTDVKVDILEQKSTALKFRVPASAAAGRYNLLVLLVGAEPTLIEEPARVRVE